MQEASAQVHESIYLPFREGYFLLIRAGQISAEESLTLFACTAFAYNQSGTPLALDALLLLALPLLLTLQKLVVLLAFGLESHQLQTCRK